MIKISQPGKQNSTALACSPSLPVLLRSPTGDGCESTAASTPRHFPPASGPASGTATSRWSIEVFAAHSPPSPAGKRQHEVEERGRQVLAANLSLGWGSTRAARWHRGASPLSAGARRSSRLRCAGDPLRRCETEN